MSLDKHLIKSYGLKLPNELTDESIEKITELIQKTKEIKVNAATDKKRYNQLNPDQIKVVKKK